MFRKLKPQRPTVIRKGDVVKTCYYFNGMKQCLGPQCFWQKVGDCPIMEKVMKKTVKAK